MLDLWLLVYCHLIRSASVTCEGDHRLSSGTSVVRSYINTVNPSFGSFLMFNEFHFQPVKFFFPFFPFILDRCRD